MSGNQGAIIGLGFAPTSAPTAQHYRRWKAIRFVDAVDPPPTDVGAIAAAFIAIQGGVRVKVLIGAPDDALDASGLIPNISNYSFRFWGEGGEEAYHPIGNPIKVDERRWAKVNKADFPDRGAETFTEDFYFEGYSRLYLQIYELELVDPEGENTGVDVTIRVM